jgi:hypothetical protein
MPRIFAGIVVAMFAVSAYADSPTDIATLVKQLGDPKFANRELAQKELLKRGEAIVPELDKLANTTDAETAERLRKIRYKLVGYKDDIRRLLAEVYDGDDRAQDPVSDELRGLIAEHQPGAGDFLLSILADPKHELRRRARRAFVTAWDSALPDQIETYIRQAVTLTATHRPKFPAKVGALVSFEAKLRDGWSGWPARASKTFSFSTRTTRYLDGKPYEKPFEYRYPFATVGWYRVGELAEGKHTIHAVLEYEFTQHGQTRKGTIRSKDSTFEVLPADTPDDLIAPKSKTLAKLVQDRFRICESERDSSAFDGVQPGRLPAQGAEHHWYPQVTWDVKPGVRAGVHCPVRKMSQPLDVDLCFDAEIHDIKSGTIYPADPIVVPSNLTVHLAWITPRDVRAFAKGRDGFVTVKVVLKPSRALALTHPYVKAYYPDPITSGELRMKVYQQVEERP